MSLARWLRRAGGASLVCLALAGPAGALEPVRHVVVEGDTLYDLAERYLDDPGFWPELARANGSPDPQRLPPGQVVVVPAELLLARAGGARVEHLSGDVSLRRGGAEARALTLDDRVLDGDVLVTARNGFVTLRLADGSLVRLAGESELSFTRLGYSVRRKVGNTRLELGRGRVESSVPPRVGGRANRFQVDTPLMSTGVRGTRFGVSVGSAGASTDVAQGRVAAATPSAGAVPVRAGMGLSSQAPGAPVRLLPAPELAGVPHLQERPLIDVAFAPVPGAVAYRAYLTRDTDLDEVVANDVFASPRARLEGLEDGRYLVAVRAIDVRGIEGAVAQAAIELRARPEPPATLAPAPGSELAGGDVALRWTLAAGVAAYDVEVARTSDFGEPISRARVAGDTHVLAGLASGDYVWRIRSLPPEGAPPGRSGPYSDPRPFSVRLPVAAQVGVELDAGRLSLSWDGEPGQRYRAQVAAEPTFAAPLVQADTDVPRLDGLALEGGVYFLRVQATDADGYVRRFSTPQRFEVTRQVRVGSGVLHTGSGSGAGVLLP